MSWIHRKAIAVVAIGAGVATILGATLGIAVAKQTTPQDSPVGGVCSNGSPGCNIRIVGNIARQPVAPGVFMQCIPAGEWVGIYIWDGANQKWLHYFNTQPGNPGNYPAYLNNPQTGAISTIPSLAGVVIIMQPGAPNLQRTFLHQAGESCN